MTFTSASAVILSSSTGSGPADGTSPSTIRTGSFWWSLTRSSTSLAIAIRLSRAQAQRPALEGDLPGLLP